MNWLKLKKQHYFKEPVEYFYASSIFDTKEYDALYENQDDPRSVVRVIDLFKIDNGMDLKSKKKSTKEAASQVKTKRSTKIDDEGVSGQILESQVQKMSSREYEAKSEEIMEAIRSGKFVYDVSGGAR